MRIVTAVRGIGRWPLSARLLILSALVTVLGFGSVVIAYLVALVIVPKDVDVYSAMPAPAPQPHAG